MTVRKKLKLLIDNTLTGNILDISFVVYFIFSCEWIPNALMNYAQNGQYWHEPVVYIGFFVLAIVFKPFYDVSSSDVDKSVRKVLVTGVSIMFYKNENGKTTTNLTPLLKPFGEYENIEKALVLLSKDLAKGVERIGNDVEESHPLYNCFQEYREIVKNYAGVEVSTDNAKEITDALSNLIKACVKIEYPDRKEIDIKNINYTNPVDYNDFQVCEKELYRLINGIRNEYPDENILVNISPGTSVVSGVMTINAIEGNRGLIYTKQYPPFDLVEFNPDVMLFHEHIEKFKDELHERQSKG